MATLNVVSICGSLRKGSYNAMVQRLLPPLAPDDMTIKPAPSFADFPLYNADIQPYEKASHEIPAAKRVRKLLLHRQEIDKLYGVPATTRNWNTIIAILRILQGLTNTR